MKKMIRVIILLLTLQPFTAQAGFFGKEEWEKDDCPKKHSLAWCLADYQGRSKGIHDMSQEDFVKALKKAGVTDESQLADMLHSGLGVSAGIGLAAIGNLFGGGVFLLSALMPSPEDQFKRQPYIVFFDDKDQTRSEKQVAIEFGAALRKAVKDALPALPKEAKVVEINDSVIKVEMPGYTCIDKFDCMVGYYAPAPNQERWFHFEKKENIPSYLGSSSVYSAQTGANVGIGWRLPRSINGAVLAKAISENLPSWMYWYIPAGYFGGNPFPLFLNQGKALFFVKPKEGDPTPVMPHVAGRLEAEKKTANDMPILPESASGVMQTSSMAD